MTKIIQQYHLQQSLGKDHLGFQIYKAKHMVTKQFFTLKSISSSQFSSSKQFQQKVLTQIKILKKFDHVNVIKFIKMLKTVHNVYLVYEFCNGGTLSDRIKKGKLTQAEQTNFMRQLVIGLRQLHKKYIMHNDINSKTIMISNNSNLKFTTFTSSMILSQIKDVEINTQKIINQQNQYQAPELKKSFDSLTLKSDIYSLGLVFYFIKFGKLHDIQNVISEENYGQVLLQIIKQMTQKDPTKRMQLQDVNIGLLSQSKSPSIKIERQSSVKGENYTLKMKKRSSQQNSMRSSKQPSPSPNKFALNLKQNSLKVPKKDIRDTSRTQSQTKSVVSEYSDKSEEKKYENIRFTTFERNKYNYLSIVSNAIIDLDVNQLSSKLSFLLFKKARLMANKLCFKISRQQSSIRDSTKSVKGNSQHDSLVKIIIKQVQQLNQSYKLFKKIILQDKKLGNDKIFEAQILEDDILNQHYMKRILKDYVNIVIQIINTNKKTDESILKKRLLHLNNVADCIDIQRFFQQYINDSVIKLSQQIYFQEIQKLDYKDIIKIVNQKCV